MKLTTQTSEDDLAKTIEKETGIKVSFAPPYDTFSAFTLRTHPMEDGIANQLADYLARDLEAGENIGDVQVLGLTNGAISIRASGIDGPVGNLFRLLQGDKPGLTIEEVVFASGVLYERTPQNDGNALISIEKDSQSVSGVRNHIRQALISHIRDLARKRGSAFSFDNDTGVSSILPAPVEFGNGVDGAYAALNLMLHRDRCVPMAYGKDHFTDGVYLVGGDAIGANPEGSRHAGTVLRNVERAMLAAGTPPEEARDQARMLLLHGYEQSIRKDYPDAPPLVDMCASRAGVFPLYNRALDAMPSLDNQRQTSVAIVSSPQAGSPRPSTGPTL